MPRSADVSVTVTVFAVAGTLPSATSQVAGLAWLDDVLDHALVVLDRAAGGVQIRIRVPQIEPGGDSASVFNRDGGSTRRQIANGRPTHMPDLEIVDGRRRQKGRSVLDRIDRPRPVILLRVNRVAPVAEIAIVAIRNCGGHDRAVDIERLARPAIDREARVDHQTGNEHADRQPLPAPHPLAGGAGRRVRHEIAANAEMGKTR